MTEGLRKAGFQSVLANEYDEMAGLTFQTNHPDVPLLIKDVKALSVNEVLERTGIVLVSKVSARSTMRIIWPASNMPWISERRISA